MVHIKHIMLIKNHNLINIHYLLTRLDGFSQNAFEDTGNKLVANRIYILIANWK